MTVKTSKASAVAYCILVGNASLLIDYEAVINKSPGGEYTLGLVTLRINAYHEPLALELVEQLDCVKRQNFINRLVEILRKDLQLNLYTLYHVGTIIE